jgi:predicted enzyme related to lactoylglutathione lyase
LRLDLTKNPSPWSAVHVHHGLLDWANPPAAATEEDGLFQGLRTVIYAVDDLAAARAWYTRVLSTEPYFSEPFYVGFDVGGFELGLDPDPHGVTRGNNAVAYWGVPDAHAAHARLLALGAREDGPVRDVGAGILVARVLDPFGNVFGIIENPHFKPGA